MSNSLNSNCNELQSYSEPNSYSGIHSVILDFSIEDAPNGVLKDTSVHNLYSIAVDVAKELVNKLLSTGSYLLDDFPYLRINDVDIRMVIAAVKDPANAAQLNEAQKSLLSLWGILRNSIDEIASLMTDSKQRYSLSIEKQKFNHDKYELKYIPLSNPKRALVMREEYHLSIFARGYGAGKTLQTFTLLPGEETEINISVTKEHEEESSSIIDSFSQKSYMNFQRTLEEQQTNVEKIKETQQMNGSASAKGSYGIGSAKGSANFNYEMQATRDTLSENMRSALESHASEASAKRVITIDAKTEKETTQNKESVFRKIKNPNERRTLNFVFRQLNQEYIAIKHLVDVRIALWDGIAFKQECSLTELDKFISDNVLDDQINLVEEALLNNLVLRDYQGVSHCLYDKMTIKNPCNNDTDVELTYRRFRQCNSKYQKNTKLCDQKDSIINEECNEPIIVPGFIIGVEAYMMKTYGIVVDAVLGMNDALEPHLRCVREEELYAQKLENLERKTLIEREKLAQYIIEQIDENDCNKADSYRKIFCCEQVTTCDFEH